MGIVLGRIFSRKATTIQALERLESEIKVIENYRKDTEQYQKKIVGRFVILSVLIYLLTAFLFYFYFFPASLYERLFYIIPLILAPVIIISVKRILTWYYTRKIKLKQSRLKSLKDEKQKLLERVMETETYKNAKVILEKYAPEQTKKPAASTTDLTPYRPLSTTYSSTALRQRALPQSSQMSRTSFAGLQSAPSRTLYQGAFRSTPATSLTNVPSTPLPLPRAILPRERSVLDKMVDYLVGDGPSNRYALICEECHSHNGMAVREEFDYISFRCCYCFHLNPARKKKPAAPQLDTDSPAKTGRTLRFSSSDTSPNDSDSDPDVHKKGSEKADEKLQEINDLYETRMGSSDFEASTERSGDSVTSEDARIGSSAEDEDVRAGPSDLDGDVVVVQADGDRAEEVASKKVDEEVVEVKKVENLNTHFKEED